MPYFTATFLNALVPKAKRFISTEANGFYISNAIGEKSFRYKYRLNGRPEKVTIGAYPSMSLSAARKWHAVMLDQVNLGESPALAKRVARLQTASGLNQLDSFGNLSEKWIEKILKPANKNSRQDETYVRRDILPNLGKRAPNEITTSDVWGCVDSVVARGHGQAARRVRSVLKRIFDYAISRGLVQHNPANAVRPAHVAMTKSRSRVLTIQEIPDWLLAIETSSIAKQTKLALRFLLLVPARKGELIGARWSEVNFVENTWDIPGYASKNGIPLKHHLPSRSMAVLRELKVLAMNSEWILPSSRGLGKAHIASSTMNSALRGIKGLPVGMVIHDLRRTVRTYLSELGIAPNVAELCLNHRPVGMIKIYDRADLIELRYAALQKWESYLDALMFPADVVTEEHEISEQFDAMLRTVQQNPTLKRYLLSKLLETPPMS